MPPDRIAATYFSPDILDFIVLLHLHDVRYVVVGGEAVIHHGHARLTGDIDFFYDRSDQNVQTLFEALQAFWGGDIPELASVGELQQEGVIIQFGRPPNRIDLLNKIDGVVFADAWQTRTTVVVDAAGGEVPLHYLGLDQLVLNKEAAGRPKDLDDLAFLRGKL